MSGQSIPAGADSWSHPIDLAEDNGVEVEEEKKGWGLCDYDLWEETGLTGLATSLPR